MVVNTLATYFKKKHFHHCQAGIQFSAGLTTFTLNLPHSDSGSVQKDVETVPAPGVQVQVVRVKAEARAAVHQVQPYKHDKMKPRQANRPPAPLHHCRSLPLSL